MPLTPILVDVVNYFFLFLQMAIVARALSSWLPISRDNAFIRMLYVVTEPVIGPVRALIQKSPLGGPGMMLDFSPMLTLLLLGVLRQVLVNFIRAL